jgi:myo-inositol-1(or 4)-monophosphatase
MTLKDDLQFIRQLAADASAGILRQYGHVARLTKTHAATTDEAVTEADRASQRLIINGLKKQFPTDGIIGEESDSGKSITFDVSDVNGRNWVIDPIDGTNNFISGLGAFAVCIGLLDHGYPVLGVVLDVTRGLTYSAAKGLGAFVNDRPIHVAQTPLGDSTMIMMTSNLLDSYGQCPAWACRWISQTVWKTRILGSAALEAVQVAAGVAHGAVTCNGKLWDVTAPAAIVLEAGGLITSLSGSPIFPFNLQNYTGAKVPFLAAGPAAQKTLLREMSENP